MQNRADVKVLLLPISSGANGLNLTEASHVILVEPILNPAQELQVGARLFDFECYLTNIFPTIR